MLKTQQHWLAGAGCLEASLPVAQWQVELLWLPGAVQAVPCPCLHRDGLPPYHRCWHTHNSYTALQCNQHYQSTNEKCSAGWNGRAAQLGLVWLELHSELRLLSLCPLLS